MSNYSRFMKTMLRIVELNSELEKLKALYSGAELEFWSLPLKKDIDNLAQEAKEILEDGRRNGVVVYKDEDGNFLK